MGAAGEPVRRSGGVCITRAVLAQHLQPGARVLDLGGGPGRYTIWLAEQGHHVTLGDLSIELLSMARTHIREAHVEGRWKPFWSWTHAISQDFQTLALTRWYASGRSIICPIRPIGPEQHPN